MIVDRLPMGEEEPLEILAPVATAVARRALVLSAVSARALIDGDWSNSDASEMAIRVRAWIAQLGLADDLDEWENGLLAAEFGRISDRDRIDASWLSEGLSVLAWALGRIDLPAFEEQCEPRRVAESLGFLCPFDATVLADPRLRSAEEIQEYGEFICNAHWRLRDFQLFGRKYDCTNLVEAASRTRFGLALKEQDLEIRGKPLYQSDADAYQTVASIVQERHRASSWLLGLGSSDYYEASTDT